MRPVLHGDVSAAARVLYRRPAPMRAETCARMIAEAEIADRFRARTGQAHPLFGNGSLMGAARKRPLAAEPGFDDVEYCRCFGQVLRALVER
ncbi:MAG: hypothetical protein ACPG61_08485 [Paracoccaceae bacterium]